MRWRNRKRGREGKEKGGWGGKGRRRLGSERQKERLEGGEAGGGLRRPCWRGAKYDALID